jgi:exonuclease VII large subunit
MADVGLGYVRLGQPLTTLSGGERQRLKLAAQMADKGDDLRARRAHDRAAPGRRRATCSGMLDRLVDSGKSVIVIEHHQAVMAHADWIIDLGPGAGHDGGTHRRFEGTPAETSSPARRVCPTLHRDRARAAPGDMSFSVSVRTTITGRAGAAEKDVVENARRRWPAVVFEIRQVAVQGPTAVTEVMAALAELDRLAEVDVIVIARGGGSLEDLLPFSNEALLRAVAAATTPVVSAIGHDIDRPLLDLVADRRASTPTDAAALVVPDAQAEYAAVLATKDRLRRTLGARLQRERERLVQLRTRPVLADPAAYVRGQREVVGALRQRAHRRLEARVHREHDAIVGLCRHGRALSPLATLDRGYALVQQVDGTIVRDPEQLDGGELLRVSVAHGDFGVRTVGGAS